MAGTVRILHVLPHAGGGGETYVDMLERLPGFGHQRFYLSSDRTPVSALASIPARWPRLAARLRAADLVHTHGDVASVIALPLLRRRPAVVTTHGLHLVRRARAPGGTAMRRSLRSVVARARVVICTSAAEREELAPVARARDRDKLRVIYNGIDPPPLVDEPERIVLRKRLGAGADTVLGLFAGRLEPRKAPLLAARAAIRVRAAGAPFVLLVAGDGPQAADVQALAGGAVKVLGYRAGLAPLLDAADVFVQPSEREGISFALLEAMGHRLAIVAADGPGNPEAVGDAGLLFAAGDETALTEALRRLSAEPGLRAALGGAARARALDQFSATRFLADTESVYRDALTPVTGPDRAAGESRA